MRPGRVGIALGVVGIVIGAFPMHQAFPRDPTISALPAKPGGAGNGKAAVRVAQPGSAADSIRALRHQSNDAIARHDVAAIVSFLDAEYQATAGSGRFLNGVEEMRAAFAEQFDRFPDAKYVRTPDSIAVDSTTSRAYERGTWVGTWTTAGAPLRTGGRYAAYWRRRDGGWKIHAELFVTLFCEGPGCDQAAGPCG